MLIVGGGGGGRQQEQSGATHYTRPAEDAVLAKGSPFFADAAEIRC